MRRFNAATAQIVQWDDHEVRDNWYPTRDLSKDAEVHDQEHGAHRRARAAGIPRVQPRAGQRRRNRPRLPHGGVRAGWSRSSRSICAATADPITKTGSRRCRLIRRFAGPTQIAWLKSRLAASRATWKVIASDMPIGAVGARRARVLRRLCQRRRRTAERARARARRSAEVHQGPARAERGVGDRRHALLRRAPLPAGARHVHRLRSVLGVRRRPAQRRHVRPEHDGRDVRPRSEVHRHSRRA